MKNIKIILAFALLACAVHATSYGGLSNITIFGNEDLTACQLTLTLAVQPNQIVFTESVFNPKKDCTFQNLQFASAFRGDQLWGNITLAPTANANILTGALVKNDLQKFNGTACGTLGDIGNGDILSTCRFRYGDIFFHLAILVDKVTGNFDATWTDLFFPNFGTTNINVTNGIYLLTQNKKFPLIVALLSQAVDTTSPIITDLNKNIWVTGTELVSNIINLNAIFGDFQLDFIIIRPKDASPDKYIVFQPATRVLPFPNAGTKGTIDTGIKWNTVVASFATCANGCDVSFILQRGYNFFVLQTNGITTQAPKNLRA